MKTNTEMRGIFEMLSVVFGALMVICLLIAVYYQHHQHKEKAVQWSKELKELRESLKITKK